MIDASTAKTDARAESPSVIAQNQRWQTRYIAVAAMIAQTVQASGSILFPPLRALRLWRLVPIRQLAQYDFNFSYIFPNVIQGR